MTLTDTQYDLADRIDEILESTGEMMTPSAIARKAKVATHEVAAVLNHLERSVSVVVEGNGTRRRYGAYSLRPLGYAQRVLANR